MRKILVATDFSVRSDRALRRGILLAKQSAAALTLVHVIDDDLPSEIVESQRMAAARLLDELSDSLSRTDGVPCEPRIVIAEPAAGITEAAQDIASDLLVLGPHRRQLLRDAFFGTTAERTIRRASCPVLMVNAPPVGPYRRVLLTTDLSEASSTVLEEYAAVAIAPDAAAFIAYMFDVPALRLTMRHALPEEDRETYLKDGAHEATIALSNFIGSMQIRPEARFVRYEGSGAAHGILECAQECSAGLIVVGTRQKRGIEKLLLGSVAEQVLENATIDVLAIPPT